MQFRIKLCLVILIALTVMLLASACNISIVITLDANGGTFASGEGTYEFIAGGLEFDLPDNPTREGYIFDNWYLDKDEWDQPLNNLSIGKPKHKKITAYARWITEEESIIQNPDCYLTLDKNIDQAGDVIGDGMKVMGSTVTINATENEGYIWLGWYQAYTFNGPQDNLVSTDPSYTFTVVSRFNTYLARWMPESGTTGLEYTLNEDGQSYSVVQGTAEDNEVYIPRYYQGMPVTILSEEAFREYDNLTFIYIPDSIINIGNLAFYNCSKLTSIDIPSSVTSIGDGVFAYCVDLQIVRLSEGIVNIGAYAFSNCGKIGAITIPGSVTDLGDYAFYNCDTLNRIDFSANSQLTSLGNGLFYDCNNFSKINIPSSVTSIGEQTFYYCNRLTKITIPDSVTTIGNGAFKKCVNLTSITLPNSVVSIGNEAFAECIKLSAITLSDNLLSIGNETFYNCDKLSSITIPNGVRDIGSNAFYNCSNLPSINIPYSVVSIGDGAFANCSKLSSVTIPSSVLSIGDSAFSNCINLESVTLSNGIQSLGMQAFNNCVKLTTITLPSSIVSIGDMVLKGCNNLESIEVSEDNDYYQSLDGVLYDKDIQVLIQYPMANIRTDYIIPNTVLLISEEAFYNCHNLSEITFEDNSQLKIIGDRAFKALSNITSLIIPDGTLSIGAHAFLSCSSLDLSIPESVFSISADAFSGTAWYNNQPDGIVYAGKVAYVFKGAMPSKTTITLLPDTTAIADNAFSGRSNLVSITIPSSVVFIGNKAFYNCNKMSSIAFEDDSQLAIIGDRAFYNCASLTDIEIPDSVILIGEGAFSSCKGLTHVVIPSSVIVIGDKAFVDCTGLRSITLMRETPPILGDDVFTYYFYQLSPFILPNLKIYVSEASIDDYKDENNWTRYKNNIYSVDIIDENGFAVDDGVLVQYLGTDTEIVIPDGVTSIADRTFYDYANLTSVIIPSSVTSIGRYAFYGCIGLTSITIPNGVTSIGSEAFSRCSNLASVTFSEGSLLTSIASYAFSYCTSLTSIIIPNNVTSIGDRVFLNCSRLSSVTVERTVPPSLGFSAFSSTHSSLKIYVNSESVDDYKGAYGWINYSNKIEAKP